MHRLFLTFVFSSSRFVAVSFIRSCLFVLLFFSFFTSFVFVWLLHLPFVVFVLVIDKSFVLCCLPFVVVVILSFPQCFPMSFLSSLLHPTSKPQYVFVLLVSSIAIEIIVWLLNNSSYFFFVHLHCCFLPFIVLPPPSCFFLFSYDFLFHKELTLRF